MALSARHCSPQFLLPAFQLRTWGAALALGHDVVWTAAAQGASEVTGTSLQINPPKMLSPPGASRSLYPTWRTGTATTTAVNSRIVMTTASTSATSNRSKRSRVLANATGW